MQIYQIDQKANNCIRSTGDDLARCVDTSTDYGRVLCGIAIKGALPWDLSPNWELRHKSPTDALLIEGLEMAEHAGGLADEVVALVALMTGMQRGMPWGWSHQASVFEVISSASQYAAAEGIAVNDLLIPRMAMAKDIALAPETVVLAATGESSGLRVGWVNTVQMTEHMPHELVQCAGEACFQVEAGRDVLPLLYPSKDPAQPAKLSLGTGGVRVCKGASDLAIGALEYLRAVAIEKMKWISLLPGQVLVLPNRFGQHAVEIKDGAAVRRIYWNRNLRAHQQRYATGSPLLHAMPSSASI